MKLLIAVNCQNEYFNGLFKNSEAKKIKNNIVKKIEEYKDNRDLVLFVFDKRDKDYRETLQAKYRKKPFCVEGTAGARAIDEVIVQSSKFDEYCIKVVSKKHFGAALMPPEIWELSMVWGVPDEIEFVGLYTEADILANIFIVQAEFSECQITVDASCMVGTSKELHDEALKIMERCHVIVKNRGCEPWRT